MTGLLAPLANSALTWITLSDGVFIASATVALAAQGLPPVLSGFARVRARGAGADVHSVGVNGVLLEWGSLVGA